MYGVIILNRRIVFGITFFFVFMCGVVLHYLITGNNEIINMLEIVVLFGASFGSAYFVAQRFPPAGKRL